MTSDLKGWKQTSIYAEVESGAQAGRSGFAETKHLLDSCMGRIQAVLQQAGTAATDFTLHDAQHGYRVAQRMVEIVPEDVLSRLTAFEFALLLLSAYLHDIGMTPEQHRVRGHYSYLLTYEPSGLAATEIDRFRQWLDEHGDGVIPPLAEGPPTGRTLSEAEWLVAHYCRERHNDWSGEWIEANLAVERLGTYQNWRDNLIAICKSHHVGFDELAHSRFDPIMVGTGHVVHLRYLAAVLRLADVMENDPERTPDVVLQQRDVDSSSLIYWQKDHDITTTKIGDQYRLEAHPRSALIHKAISDTAAMIEAELLVCRRLADETDFSRLRGSSAELPHRWDLSATLTQRIEPLDDAYEYIDGSFRPDVRRVLRLLAGVELYGDPMAAVRELLQNAFDAVRERIARERLSDPGNLDLPDMLGKVYSVQLHLERGTDGDWLVCKDRGAGMSKSIIRDHFLVSGAVKRADLLQLARRCEQAGFRLERTARFGIGVLSYFMVADRLHIRTRRCQSAQSGEANGWSFETDGLSGFGELKRDTDCLEGTEVRLRLKPEVIGTDASAFWDRLLRYVRSVLLHVPCRLQIKCPPISEASWSVDAPGWVRKPGDYATQSLTVLESPEARRPSGWGDLPEQLGDLTPSERLDQWQGEQDRRARLREAAHGRLRWSEPVTGDLPGGLGRFRLFFPWFELDDGPCLDFFTVRTNGDARVLDTGDLSEGGHGVSPWCPFVMGWFGMAADHDINSMKEYRWRGVIEVDWTALTAAGLDVSRDRLQPSEQALAAIRDLSKSLAEQISEFARSNQASMYALYNTTSLNIAPPSAKYRFWLYQHETEPRFDWRLVSYPAILPESIGIAGLMADRHWRWQGHDYPRLSPIDAAIDRPGTGHLRLDRETRFHRMSAFWDAVALPPDQLLVLMQQGVVLESGHFRHPWFWRRDFITVCTNAPIWREPRVAYPEVEFPPEWQQVCLVTGRRVVYWNRAHWLVRATSKHAWERLTGDTAEGLDLRTRRAEFAASAELSAAWLLYCLSRENQALVRGLAEHAPDLTQALWESASTGQAEPTCWAWVEHAPGGSLVEIGAHGWRGFEPSKSENRNVLEQVIPKPSEDWCVYPISRANEEGQ